MLLIRRAEESIAEMSEAGRRAAHVTYRSDRRRLRRECARRSGRRHGLGRAPLARALSGQRRIARRTVRRSAGKTTGCAGGRGGSMHLIGAGAGHPGNRADRGGHSSAGRGRGAGLQNARRRARRRGIFRRRRAGGRQRARNPESGGLVPAPAGVRLRKQSVLEPPALERAAGGGQPASGGRVSFRSAANAWTATMSKQSMTRRGERWSGRARAPARRFSSAGLFAGEGTWARARMKTWACERRGELAEWLQRDPIRRAEDRLVNPAAMDLEPHRERDRAGDRRALEAARRGPAPDARRV